MNENKLCPCGSTIDFEQCCDLLHKKIKLANSPEQLMRSRYSAYAMKSVPYIYDTYAKASQSKQSINDIEQWADSCNWVHLKIINTTTAINDIQQQDTVEFSAFYLVANKLFVMHELSRFVFEDNQWRYLDGDIKEQRQIKTLNRNDLCPCHSGNKFKKCCGK